MTPKPPAPSERTRARLELVRTVAAIIAALASSVAAFVQITRL